MLDTQTCQQIFLNILCDLNPKYSWGTRFHAAHQFVRVKMIGKNH